MAGKKTTDTPTAKPPSTPAQAGGAGGSKKSGKKKLERRVASSNNPTLEAICASMFRFDSEAQAQAVLNRVRQQFILSKEQETDNPTHAVRLWIRGFALSEEELQEGYLGHYAIIRVKKVTDNRFTLFAEKQPVELHLHPQRKRPPRKQPDWGHPIMRRIKKGKPYGNVDEARAELLRLHEEFPETSIPGKDKLHIIVYNKLLNKMPPIEKITLRVTEPEDGSGVKIIFMENLGKQKKDLPGSLQKTPPTNEDGSPAEPAGYYTKLLAAQRAKKKKK